MSSKSQIIDERYDNLMFAKSPEAARKAAVELVRAVLGDEANGNLAESLRECCRRLRPAPDPLNQARFEEEFLELAFWPNHTGAKAA